MFKIKGKRIQRSEQKLLKKNGYSYCSGCKKALSFSKFSKSKRTWTGYSNYCKKCSKPPEGYWKKYKKSVRKEAMKKLGGIKCSNCGCDEFNLLEINHKNGGGREEYRKVSPTKIYMDIAKEKINIKDYDVRCKVCNVVHYIELKKGIARHNISWK